MPEPFQFSLWHAVPARPALTSLPFGVLVAQEQRPDPVSAALGITPSDHDKFFSVQGFSSPTDRFGAPPFQRKSPARPGLRASAGAGLTFLASSGPRHHHIDVRATAFRADKPLAPIGHSRLGAVSGGRLGRIGLDLMLTVRASSRT